MVGILGDSVADGTSFPEGDAGKVLVENMDAPRGVKAAGTSSDKRLRKLAEAEEVGTLPQRAVLSTTLPLRLCRRETSEERSSFEVKGAEDEKSRRAQSKEPWDLQSNGTGGNPCILDSSAATDRETRDDGIGVTAASWAPPTSPATLRPHALLSPRELGRLEGGCCTRKFALGDAETRSKSPEPKARPSPRGPSRPPCWRCKRLDAAWLAHGVTASGAVAAAMPVADGGAGGAEQKNEGAVDGADGAAARGFRVGFRLGETSKGKLVGECA